MNPANYWEKGLVSGKKRMLNESSIEHLNT